MLPLSYLDAAMSSVNLAALLGVIERALNFNLQNSLPLCKEFG